MSLYAKRLSEGVPFRDPAWARFCLLILIHLAAKTLGAFSYAKLKSPKVLAGVFSKYLDKKCLDD